MKTETPPSSSTAKVEPQVTKRSYRNQRPEQDYVTISKQTEQVSTALLRFKKYGKIKSVERGVQWRFDSSQR